MEPAEQTVKKDFFISYNKADKAWAEWIGWHLEESGYSVIIQAWDFRPGGNFVLDMQRAATEAERTIAVLSPDYLTSDYTAPEWAAAFGQDPTGKRGLLIPVRVRECKLEGLLPQIVYIDSVKQDETTARQRLLDGVKRGRAKPETAPNFPGALPRPAIARPRFPDTPPPVWHVPHPRNPHFTGRKGLLDELETALHTGQAAALTQAVTGLGGVGKTQLATEYAYRHMSDYAIVWWLRSEESVTLSEDFRALGIKLGLPLEPNTQPEIVREAVRQALAQRRDWLLIFDNANKPEEIASYLPQGGYRHVLVTSRNPNWGAFAQPLPVKKWERKSSIAFLLKRNNQTDTTAANSVADALGDLPLALAQAAAYCEQAQIPLSEYAALFRAYRKDMLQSGAPSVDYEETVATTWDMAFKKIRETPLAAELLNLSAFLAPDDIPRDLLQVWPKVENPIQFNKAVAALLSYSLIEAADGALSAHRLVQSVTRDRLSEAELQSYAEEAVELIIPSYPEDIWTNVAVWDNCARLLPHGFAAAGHAEALASVANNCGLLLNQLGNCLLVTADLAKARNAFERALKIDEAAYGPEHPEVAIRVNNLGYVLKSLGDLAGAKAHYERALKIDEAAFGPEHPKVAIRVNNLGGVLGYLGDLAGAKAHLERAVAIFRKFLGEEHPNTKTVQENLDRVLAEMQEKGML